MHVERIVQTGADRHLRVQKNTCVGRCARTWLAAPESNHFFLHYVT
jgi:hypothetical protein